jgi:glycogen operon protein
VIDLRRSRLWLRRDTFLKGTRRGVHAKDVTWLHPSGRELTDRDWNDVNLRTIAVHMDGAPSRAADSGDLLAIFNADDADIEMILPVPPPDSAWRVLFDTASDAEESGSVPFAPGQSLRVGGRSTLLLESVTV